MSGTCATDTWLGLASALFIFTGPQPAEGILLPFGLETTEPTQVKTIKIISVLLNKTCKS